MANINIGLCENIRKGKSLIEQNQMELDAKQIALAIYKHYGCRFKNTMQILLAEVDCTMSSKQTKIVTFQLNWFNSGSTKTRSCEIFISERSLPKPQKKIHDYHGFESLKKRLNNGTLYEILK